MEGFSGARMTYYNKKAGNPSNAYQYGDNRQLPNIRDNSKVKVITNFYYRRGQYNLLQRAFEQ